VGSQHAARFGDRALGLWQMQQPEADQDPVETLVGQVQPLRVAFAELQPRTARSGDPHHLAAEVDA
jgi:hypothetical protein